jgi:hypothetical protein
MILGMANAANAMAVASEWYRICFRDRAEIVMSATGMGNAQPVEGKV